MTTRRDYVGLENTEGTEEEGPFVGRLTSPGGGRAFQRKDAKVAKAQMKRG